MNKQQQNSNGLYALYTPTTPARRNRVVIEQRVKRLQPLIKDIQVGQAFAIERIAGAWTRYYLANTYPQLRFIVSIPKDKNLPAEVRLISAKYRRTKNKK